mmetsp:Transcript_35425/g.102026  ORF Transcript_35425/g.102026 Transcript_35425/m.102026 type:complete len:302 (+) Transcript_35425:1868-2773(+)
MPMAPGPAPMALLQTRTGSRRHASAAFVAEGPAPSPSFAPSPQAVIPGSPSPGGFVVPGLVGGAGMVNGSFAMNGTNGTNGTFGAAGGAKSKYADLDWEAYLAKLRGGVGLRPNQAMLEAGGHCLDILIAVTPEGRTLQLTYKGPDTAGTMTVIPGQVLWCDPVVQACSNPALDTCALYRPKCSGTDMPFAGPTLPDYSKMPTASMPEGAGLAPGALSAVMPGALMMPGAQPMQVAPPDAQAVAVMAPPPAPAPPPALAPNQPPAGLTPVNFVVSEPPDVQAPARAQPDQSSSFEEDAMDT